MRLLRDSLTKNGCRTTILSHVSSCLSHYKESVATIQLASRMHRLKRRKNRVSGSGFWKRARLKWHHSLRGQWNKPHLLSGDGWGRNLRETIEVSFSFDQMSPCKWVLPSYQYIKVELLIQGMTFFFFMFLVQFFWKSMRARGKNKQTTKK